VVSYHPNRRGSHVEVIEDCIPLRDVRVELRLAHRPREVYMAPDRTVLPVDYREGAAIVVVPEVRENAMVVFEE